MATKKKLLQAAAGAAGGGGLNVEEVFSTDLWEGTGSSTNTITNNIDISGEGGLVWVHSRSRTGEQYILTDTENGQGKALDSSSTSSLSTTTESVQNLNSDGYSFSGDLSPINRPNDTYVGWTFRKAPKFFDVVTYTGNGTGGRAISHNLGSVPGTIIVKQTSSVSNWPVYHRSLGSSAYVELNSTGAQTSNVLRWNGTDPTSTDFTVNVTNVNKLNETYVAYLFAHNDGDGEFGPDGDADIIKCGSYTGGTSGIEIDLGFEPQWLLIKSVDSANSWFCVDNMRGFDGDNGSNSTSTVLRLNTSGSENTGSFHIAQLLPNGFTINSVNYESNASGEDYIYIAIRRGPMAVPEDADDVFAIDTLGGTSPTPPGFNSGFPVDMAFLKPKSSSSDWLLASRLIQGKQLVTNSTAAEVNETANVFDYMNGYYDFPYSDSNYQAWMWKRAPSYFDVVAYGATGETNPSVSHNLGVAPEMIWHKERDRDAPWSVAHSYDFTKRLVLDSTSAEVSYQFVTNITDTSFNINFGGLGAENSNKIMYLFASLDGVSKVGSYTGTGATLNIDCGFSSGARFVLIRRTDANGSWWVHDTERGITTGNDGMLRLDGSDAEITNTDQLSPYSSGFTVASTATSDFNASGGSYVFYAIA